MNLIWIHKLKERDINQQFKKLRSQDKYWPKLKKIIKLNHEFYKRLKHQSLVIAAIQDVWSCIVSVSKTIATVEEAAGVAAARTQRSMRPRDSKLKSQYWWEIHTLLEVR